MPVIKIRYLLVLVFTLLAGIWAFRTVIAELIIVSAMHGSGLTDISADIHQLDPDQSHLSHIEFSLINESRRLQLEAHGLSVNYNLGQLIDGRVSSITINKLSLRHENVRTAEDDAPAKQEVMIPQEIIEALRRTLSKYIFFKSLSIQQLTLHGDSFGALQGKPLRLDSKYDDAALTVELSLLNQSLDNQDNVIRSLVITSFSDESFTAELKLSTIPEALAAKLELVIHDTDITGNYRVDPQRLQQWLQPVTNIYGIDDIAPVKGTLSLNFGSGNQTTSTVTANSEHIEYTPYKAEHVSMKLSFNSLATSLFQHVYLENGSYIKFNNFRVDSSSLANTRFNLAGELTNSTNSWQYKGGISSELIVASYESQTVSLKELAASISANTEKLTVDGNFSTATVPGKFSFFLDNDLTKKTGHLNIIPLKPIKLSGNSNKLSQLLTPWRYPFDLLTGNITASLQASWSLEDDFRLTTGIKLDDAGGHYGELLFSGLYLDHELVILPELHSIRTGKINIAHLDSGVTVSNISTSLTIKKTADSKNLPVLFVQGLGGEILGGTFSGDDFVLDLNKSKNSFIIKADNIDLAAIIETQQLKDITVTGSVDGTIPVIITGQGISIDKGAFISDVRAGIIRYNPGAGTDQLKQNPLTGIALDALKDFRYSDLSAGVNYTPEGLLTINLQLKGTSPELDTDRPVHLNINTEQNLISLLKSLRFAQGISDDIDNKVRHQYEKSRSKH